MPNTRPSDYCAHGRCHPPLANQHNRVDSGLFICPERLEPGHLQRRFDQRTLDGAIGPLLLPKWHDHERVRTEVLLGSSTAEGGMVCVGSSTVDGSEVALCGVCSGEARVGVGCITLSFILAKLRQPICRSSLYIVGLWQAGQDGIKLFLGCIFADFHM